MIVRAMKRRYTVLFFLSVIAMVGWSWHASTSGSSVWSMIDIGLFGLISATAVAGFATIFNYESRGPLILIAIASLLGAGQVPTQGSSIEALVSEVGPAVILIWIGSIATFLGSLIVALMPPPKDNDSVAAARVVD